LGGPTSKERGREEREGERKERKSPRAPHCLEEVYAYAQGRSVVWLYAALHVIFIFDRRCAVPNGRCCDLA